MTERYVDGANGNDAWDGLAKEFVSGTNGPKATINGAEDTPVVAGDLVHVRPTTYRELHTIDVSGTGGNVVEFRGDYKGLIWPNPTGLVPRITGSDNDQAAARASCITASSKNYRTFRYFDFDITSGVMASLTSPQNWIIDGCHFDGPAATAYIQISGASQLACTIQNCKFMPANARGIDITHTVTVDNTGHVIQNCIMNGFLGRVISDDRIGGVTVRNSIIIGGSNAVRVATALTGGQTVTVNNCILVGLASVALQATVLGELVENYNALSSNVTDRTNVATGANSNTYPPLFGARWFFELVSGNGRMLSPFDLASYSQLVNVAGTSPTTTDMRGTSVIGAQREWGALEYDPALLFRRVIGRQV